MVSSSGLAAVVGGVALALIGFVRFFLMQQIKDLREDVVTLDEKLLRLEREYDRQRGLKHRAFNDVARTVMALDLVQRLARECTCGVLSPLEEVVSRLVEELETLPHRRHDDPIIEGVTP